MAMDTQSRLALSYYKEIADINREHNIYLVQHIDTNKVYVKKILYHYNKDIYYKLKEEPVMGLPKLYEAAVDDDELIIIEEYISGDTVEEMLEAGRKISFAEACGYVLKLCDILNRLHACRPPIIHRDIKPSNVMITPDGKVVLIDLNAAKFVNNQSKSDTTLLGTAGYAAPEQYGFGASDEKTDIYALGMLMKDIFGRLCTEDDSAAAAVGPIIEKCTYLDPKERYENINEVRKALHEQSFADIPQIPETPAEMTGDTISVNSHQKSHGLKKYLLPGYRSGNPLHYLIGTAGYVFIIWISATMKMSNKTPAGILLERISSFLVMLSVILVSCNYLEIQRYFPMCKSTKPFVRTMGVILLDIIVVFAILIFMCLCISVFG